MKKAILLLGLTVNALIGRSMTQANQEIFTPIEEEKSFSVVNLDPARAKPYMSGFTKCENGEFLTSEILPPKKSAGACWSVHLNQKTPETIRIVAEASVLSGMSIGDVLLYVDVTYMDGDNLWGQKARFPNTPSAWAKRSVVIMPVKPVKSCAIYVMAKDDTSLRMKFRTPSVHIFKEMPDYTLFDTLPVRVKTLLEKPAFLVRDLKAKSGFETIGKEAKGVSISVKKERKGTADFYDVTLNDTQGGDRAITLVWANPLGNVKNLVWFDSTRSGQDVSQSKRDCRDIATTPCGVRGHSRWPLIAASADGKGIAIGFDPRLPAFSRLSLQSALRIMYSAFDIALVPENNSARVGFVVFPFDAKYGLRGALEEYRKLFPVFNEVKQKKQGLWMAFKPISKVEKWEDFGFAIKEGYDEAKWDDAHGITTYRYTEPTTWWMKIDGKDGRSQPTMAECLAEAERLAKNGHAYARAWKKCAIKDALGNPCGRVLDTPWCKGIVWNMNCAPGHGKGCEFDAKLGEENFKKVYKGEFPEGVDGEYVDSSEMYVTATMDYNRENFKGMKTPLVFDFDSLKPVVFKGMMGYEYVRGAWERCRAIGRRTMANSTPASWWWLAPYLDVLGSEVDWGHNGKWTPWEDARMMYVRSLCGGKPFCFLMNTDFDKFPYEMQDKYMQRALAYGMYPSFFSPVASSKSHYFTTPRYYNAGRPLFKKYVPLCIRVGEAGWRTVNEILSTDKERVVTEQFGENYATVYNLDTNTVRVTLKSLKGATKARELLSGEEWDFKDGKYAFDIPGETVRVLFFGD